jgi:N6-L-threonylcarbamoyladenine synthase
MIMDKTIAILGIESSCDDTAAALICNGKILANVVANQEVHRSYGGVVPELASRAHQQNIIPVVHKALQQANIRKEDLSAIAFTRGPGLMGSLLVGSSFAKSFALGLGIPLIEVNHMQGHILAHFIQDDRNTEIPEFPFLCLTVSGGHTQIVVIKDHFDMTVLGETIDDAAGEAFDKAAKIMGLPYPGGPLIDKHAKSGNPHSFNFPKPHVPGLDFSFSGLKTAFMNFINTESAKDPQFVEKNRDNICASMQHTIIEILMSKLISASEETGIRQIAIAGGVSANSGLRARLKELETEKGWKVFIPPFEYCTDNAAMIAITGYYKFLKNDFASQDVAPLPRYALKNT